MELKNKETLGGEKENNINKPLNRESVVNRRTVEGSGAEKKGEKKPGFDLSKIIKMCKAFVKGPQVTAFKKVFKNLFKKIGDLVSPLKKKYLALPKKGRRVILVALIVILVLITGGIVWGYTKKSITEKWNDISKDMALKKDNAILFETKPLLTGEAGDMLSFGHLEVTYHNFYEGSYQGFEKDDRGRRITKDFLGVQLNVFNFSNEETQNLLIGLKDDKGGLHLVDESVPFYVGDRREFGRNRYIYPRIIQEGYIFFSGINPEAKKLKLLIGIEQSKEVVEFEIER